VTCIDRGCPGALLAAPKSPSTWPSDLRARDNAPVTSRAAATLRSGVTRGVRRLATFFWSRHNGFHAGNPQPATEEVPTTGSETSTTRRRRPKLEAVLGEVLAAARSRPRLFPPASSPGPRRRSGRADGAQPPRRAIGAFPAPGIRAPASPAPVLPDAGVADPTGAPRPDVALALAAAIRARAPGCLPLTSPSRGGSGSARPRPGRSGACVAPASPAVGLARRRGPRLALPLRATARWAKRPALGTSWLRGPPGRGAELGWDPPTTPPRPCAKLRPALPAALALSNALRAEAPAAARPGAVADVVTSTCSGKGFATRPSLGGHDAGAETSSKCTTACGPAACASR